MCIRRGLAYLVFRYTSASVWDSVSSRFFRRTGEQFAIKNCLIPTYETFKTCIAVSLDGFIARKDNDLDWMLENVKRKFRQLMNNPVYFLPE